MYAIIETGGKQYWVVPGQTLKVEKLDTEAGKELSLASLWSAEEGKESASPAKNAKVVVEVLRHLRGEKIIIFKKRPKKGYKKLQGHRQELTEIRIKDISLS